MRRYSDYSASQQSANGNRQRTFNTSSRQFDETANDRPFTSSMSAADRIRATKAAGSTEQSASGAAQPQDVWANAAAAAPAYAGLPQVRMGKELLNGPPHADFLAGLHQVPRPSPYGAPPPPNPYGGPPNPYGGPQNPYGDVAVDHMNQRLDNLQASRVSYLSDSRQGDSTPAAGTGSEASAAQAQKEEGKSGSSVDPWMLHARLAPPSDPMMVIGQTHAHEMQMINEGHGCVNELHRALDVMTLTRPTDNQQPSAEAVVEPAQAKATVVVAAPIEVQRAAEASSPPPGHDMLRLAHEAAALVTAGMDPQNIEYVRDVANRAAALAAVNMDPEMRAGNQMMVNQRIEDQRMVNQHHSWEISQISRGHAMVDELHTALDMLDHTRHVVSVSEPSAEQQQAQNNATAAAARQFEAAQHESARLQSEADAAASLAAIKEQAGQRKASHEQAASARAHAEMRQARQAPSSDSAHFRNKLVSSFTGSTDEPSSHNWNNSTNGVTMHVDRAAFGQALQSSGLHASTSTPRAPSLVPFVKYKSERALQKELQATKQGFEAIRQAEEEARNRTKTSKAASDDIDAMLASRGAAAGTAAIREHQANEFVKRAEAEARSQQRNAAADVEAMLASRGAAAGTAAIQEHHATQFVKRAEAEVRSQQRNPAAAMSDIEAMLANRGTAAGTAAGNAHHDEFVQNCSSTETLLNSADCGHCLSPAPVNHLDMVLVAGGTVNVAPQFHIHPDDLARMIALFDRLDKNKDGALSHIEIIKAMRTDKEELGPILGLEARNIKQEDGTRANLERVFQAMDGDNSKGITKGEWLAYFRTSEHAAQAHLSLEAAGADGVHSALPDARLISLHERASELVKGLEDSDGCTEEKVAEAREVVDALVKLEPTNGRVHGMRGVVLMQLGLQLKPVTDRNGVSSGPAKRHDRQSLIGAIGAFNRAAELQPAECGHGANEMVDALAKEMVAGLMSEFEENEFEFFDLKSLEEAMASDKLGRVKEEAQRIAAHEIEKITSKKFFCSTSQLQTLQAVVALATGKITDSQVQDLVQSPDMRSM